MGPGIKYLTHNLWFVAGGEDYRFLTGTAICDATGYLQATQLGQINVEHYDVRAELASFLYRLISVGCFSTHFPFEVAGDQGSQDASRVGAGISNQNANRSQRSILIGRPPVASPRLLESLSGSRNPWGLEI